MTEIAEPRRASLGRETPLLSPLWISLTGCVATIAAVDALVLATTAAAMSSGVVLAFVIGNALVFGVALSNIVRVRDRPFARALIGAGLLWSLSALAASHE